MIDRLARIEKEKVIEALKNVTDGKIRRIKALLIYSRLSAEERNVLDSKVRHKRIKYHEFVEVGDKTYLFLKY